MKQISYITPTKIVLTDGNVKNAESLLKTKTAQIGLGENDLTIVSGNARVVLDFGREICGGVTHTHPLYQRRQARKNTFRRIGIRSDCAARR